MGGTGLEPVTLSLSSGCMDRRYGRRYLDGDELRVHIRESGRFDDRKRLTIKGTPTYPYPSIPFHAPWEGGGWWVGKAPEP